MRRTSFQLFYLLMTGVVILSACNMPGNNAAAETAPPTKPPATNATATIPLTATQTEVPSTETPTATATETLLPEPSATPEPPIAEVVRETNCRVGPAGNYDLVATYQVGQKLDVVAKDLGAGYWFVRNSEKPEEECYLLAQNITINGDTSALPKFTPRPSPTAAPYFSVAFKKYDTCEGEDFALFDVTNTGSVPFRSVYIKVTNQKNNDSVEHVLNAFDLRVRCVLAKNIAPLDPGAAGYVASPPFKWSSGGNKMRAVIMLCTEKDLKGTCVTQSLDLKD